MVAARAGMLTGVRVATSIALLSLPASAGIAGQRSVTLSKRLALDYEIAGGALKRCNLHASTGDPSVDTAICGLLQHCVAEGATTQDAALACLEPRYARLAQLIGAGLLDAIGDLPDADEAGAAAAGKREEDIVVTGTRLPKPGLWLMTERGRRIMYAQDNMMFTLPARTWRRCIEPDAVATAIADMMRFNPRGQVRGNLQGPCGWTVTAGDATLTGKQTCALRGGMLRGTMKGAFSATRFQVDKETRYRQLSAATALQKQQRATMEAYGEMVAGPDDEAYPRLSQADWRQIPESLRDNLQDNADDTTVVGIRLGDCPRSLS